MENSPAFPHSWPDAILWFIASVLLYGGGLTTAWVRRRREPVELAKIAAETHSIDIASELSVITALREAVKDTTVVTERAERLLQERNHWERKAEDFYLKLEGLQFQFDQQGTILRMAENDVKKQRLLLALHNIPYSEADVPKQ